MNQNDADRLLASWFEATAPDHEPPGLIDEVVSRVRRTGRRPGWLASERWIPMQTTLRLQRMPALVPILIVAGVLVLGAIAALLIAGAPRPLPPPFGLADNGRIAYVADGQIWTAAPDASDSRAIAADGTTMGLPTFSRDGTRLAYLTSTSPTTNTWSLIVADADGRNPVTIEEPAEVLLHYSWSPDGRTIAFSKWIVYPGQRDRVFMASVDGSSPPLQVGDPDLSAFNPAFSPDGTRLLFISDHCQPTDCSDNRFALHVMNADGSGIRELTGINVVPVEGLHDGTRGFEWSPDGSTVLFTGKETSRSQVGLYLASVDGSLPIRRLSDEVTPLFGGSWSPNGDRIAYLRGSVPDQRDVIVANADGTNPRVVASGVYGFSPQWSPDGSSMAVVVHPASGETAMRIVDVDTGDIVATFPTGRLVNRDDAAGIGWQRVAD